MTWDWKGVILYVIFAKNDTKYADNYFQHSYEENTVIRPKRPRRCYNVFLSNDTSVLSLRV